MIDVSNLSPLFIQIPILLILVLGVISGLKDGIFKKLFDFLLFVVLIFAMIFMVPPLATSLENTGWIQNFVNKTFTGDFATLISGLLTRPAYIILVIIGILIVYGILKLIINLLIKTLFRGKGLIGRTLGAIWQLIINLAVCMVLLAIFASPMIFKGGEELINNSFGLKQIYQLTNKVQLVLEKNDLPYSVESLAARYFAGEDASKEDIDRYTSTFSRVGDLLDSYQDGTIINEYVDSEGNLNQEKANQLVDDMIVFSEIVNKLPEPIKGQYVEPIESILTQVSDPLIDESGNATQTITVTSEQKETLDTVLNNLGVKEEIKTNIDKILQTA